MYVNVACHPATLLIGFALATTACDTQAPDVSDAQVSPNDRLGTSHVAIVNDTAIAESVFRLYTLNVVQQSADEITGEQRNELIDDLIDFVLIAEAAERAGLTSERRIAAELELQRLQLIASRMAQRHLDQHPPTEDEIRAVYEESLPQLTAMQYRARHILTETEDLAREVIRRLEQGDSFSDLAAEHSRDSSDLGWFTLESTVPAFADGIRDLEPGSHSSAPIETQYGWHVILLDERRTPEPPSMESLRNELRNVVENRRIDQLVEELRANAVIRLTDR